MFSESCPGNAETFRDSKTDSAKVDETGGFWTNCRFITKPGGIQR